MVAEKKKGSKFVTLLLHLKKEEEEEEEYFNSSKPSSGVRLDSREVSCSNLGFIMVIYISICRDVISN